MNVVLSGMVSKDNSCETGSQKDYLMSLYSSRQEENWQSLGEIFVFHILRK